MISCDLFFTHIKIKHNYTNSLVCKMWYDNIKKYLLRKKIEHYDKIIHNIIISKLYNEYTLYIKFMSKENYDKMIDKTMQIIITDNNLNKIMKQRMLEYNRSYQLMYNKYCNKIKYCEVDKKIAEEYKKILDKYFHQSYITKEISTS